jgi:hypothetical protein
MTGHLDSECLSLASGETVPDEVASVLSIFLSSNLDCVLREKLLFGATAPAEAKDLNHGVRQIKALRNVRRQAFEIDEVAVDVLHRFAACAYQVMMWLEIAVDQQGRGMRRNLAQKAAFHEETEIVGCGAVPQHKYLLENSARGRR